MSPRHPKYPEHPESLLRTLGVIFLLTGSLLAQTAVPSATPEVRRAIAVTPNATSAASPAPVSASGPALYQTPSFSSPPPSSAPSSVSPSLGKVVPSPSPEGSEIIRVAPDVAPDPVKQAEAQLVVADGFYGRKLPDMAIPEYEKFLIMTSKGAPGRDRAFFRLGESQRTVGNITAAQSAYRHLLDEFAIGAFAASASYRMGEIFQSEKSASDAAAAYARAVELSPDPGVRNSARYQEALCRDQLGQKDRATVLLEEAAQADGHDPARDYARMALAERAAAAGNKEEALTAYQTVTGSGSKGPLVREATVKAALILNDLGRRDEARKLFEKAAAPGSKEESGSWGGVAALGAMHLAYDGGDYKEAIKMAEQVIATVNTANAAASSSSNSLVATGSFSAEAKPQAMLLEGNARRQLGEPAKAIIQYDQIIHEFSGSTPARDAAFQRLLALQTAGNKNLPKEIDDFLLTVTDPHQHAQAQLLKAEGFFRAGDYAKAAAAYGLLESSDLSKDSKADALYKEAWCLTQAGDAKGATDILTRFIESYPDDPQIPSAIVQRALLHQQLEDLPGAIADFTILIDHYPKAKERELALQQKALALGQQQDNAGMVEAFEKLLEDYPKSAAAAQAQFWTGWAHFEAKEYAKAIVNLDTARKLDAKQFGERAGLRILLAHYYLEEVDETVKEASSMKLATIPGEVSRWLGLKAYERGDMAQTEHYLMAVAENEKSSAAGVDVLAALAQALIAQGKFREAVGPAAKSLELAHDPAARAQALLTSAEIQRGLKNYNAAEKMVEEALLLQPEGRLNAEARIFSGDLLVARQDYDAAARAYMTVAVLTDDPQITPKALGKAADAYRRANNPTESEKAILELHRRFPSAPLEKKLSSARNHDSL